MNRKSLWIGAVMIVRLAAASVVALTGLGGSVGAADDLVIQGLPPSGGGSCICSANWEPVVCRASDGSRHAFSNLCVAGCYGYSDCARIVVAP
jgi:hypothetical protein